MHFPDKNETRIQDVNLEREETEALDPRPEIEAKWAVLKECLEALRKQKRWDSFATTAIIMKTLFPDWEKELGLNAEVRNGLHNQLLHAIRSESPGVYDPTDRKTEILNVGSFFKQLFPKELQAFTFDDDLIKELAAYAKSWLDIPEYEYAQRFLLLWPTKRNLLALDTRWDHLKRGYDGYREFIHLIVDVELVALASANLRLLFPEHDAEIKLTPEELEISHEKLQKGLTEWKDFHTMNMPTVYLCQTLTLASADRVWLDETGIHYEFLPKEKPSKIPPPPTVRNF